MFTRRRLVLVPFAIAATIHCAGAASCVWKATNPAGQVVYLGGSVHALRSADYPLPPAYNRAFDASSRIAFEVEPKALENSMKGFVKSGEYAKDDSLKNHVDPRTYDYLRRLFGLMHVPEEKFARYRPWFLALVLQSPSIHGFSSELGVEGFLEKRARANHKPMTGLESASEHLAIFSGLTDRQSEAVLLLTFIPQSGGAGQTQLLSAWRRGDADALAQMMKDSYRDYPAFGERLLDMRNRNWIPKIEEFARSGQTYFVVAGAAHMGGPNGVLSLLRQRGYRIEQL